MNFGSMLKGAAQAATKLQAELKEQGQHLQTRVQQGVQQVAAGGAGSSTADGESGSVSSSSGERRPSLNDFSRDDLLVFVRQQNGKLKIYEQELRKLQTKNKELETAPLGGSTGDGATDVGALRTRNQELTGKLQELVVKYKALLQKNQELEATVKAPPAPVEMAPDLLTGSPPRSGAFSSSDGSSEAEVTALRTQLEKVLEEVNTLQSEREKMISKMKEMAMRYRQLQEEKETLIKQQTSDATAEVTASLSAKIEQLTTELDAAKRSSRGSGEDIAALKEALNRQQEENVTLVDKLQQAAGKFKQMQHQLQEQQKTIQQLEVQKPAVENGHVENLTQNAKALEDQLQNLTSELATLKAEKEGLLQQVDAERNVAGSRSKELEDLKAQFITFQQKTKVFAAQKHEQISQLTQQVKSLTEQVQATRQSSEATEKLSSIIKEREEELQRLQAQMDVQARAQAEGETHKRELLEELHARKAQTQTSADTLAAMKEELERYRETATAAEEARVAMRQKVEELELELNSAREKAEGASKGLNRVDELEGLQRTQHERLQQLEKELVIRSTEHSHMLEERTLLQQHLQDAQSKVEAAEKELEETVSGLRRDVGDKDRELGQLKNKLKEMAEELKQEGSRRSDMARKQSELEARLEERAAELDRLKSEREDAAQNLSQESSRMIDALTTRVKERDAELTNLREQVANLERALEGQRSSNEVEMLAALAAKEQLEAQLSEAGERLNAKEMEATEATTQLRNLQQKAQLFAQQKNQQLGEAAAQIEALSLQVKNAEAAAEEAKKALSSSSNDKDMQVNKLLAQVEELEQKLASATADHQKKSLTWQSESQRFQHTLKELQDDVSTHKAESDSLREEVRRKEAEAMKAVEEVEATKHALQLQVERLSSEAEEQKEQMQQDQQSLLRLQEDLENALKRGEALENRLAASEAAGGDVARLTQELAAKKNEVIELKQEVERSLVLRQEAVSKAEADSQSLKEELERAIAEANSANTRVREIEQEHQQLQIASRRAVAENEQLKTKVTEAEDELQRAAQQFQHMKEQATTRLKQAAEETELLKRQLQTADDELQRVKEQLDTERLQAASGSSSMQETLKAIQEEKQDLERAHQQKREELESALEASQKQLRGQEAKSKGDKDELTGKLKELIVRYKALQQQLAETTAELQSTKATAAAATGKEEELHALKLQLEEVTSRASDRETAMSNLQASATVKLQEAQTQLENAEKEKHDLATKLDEAVENGRRLAAELEAQQGSSTVETDALRATLGDAQHSLKQAQEELERAKAEIESLKDAQENQGRVAEELEALRLRLSTQEGELTKEKERISTLTSQLSTSEAAVQKLTTELEVASSSVSQKEDIVLDLRGQLATVVKENEDVKIAFETYRSKAGSAIKKLTAEKEEAGKRVEELVKAMSEQADFSRKEVEKLEQQLTAARLSGEESSRTYQQKVDALQKAEEELAKLQEDRRHAEEEAQRRLQSAEEEKVELERRLGEQRELLTASEQAKEELLQKVEAASKDLREKSDVAKRMLVEKDKEIEELVGNIRTLEDKLKAPKPENAAEQQILEFARLQAQRDEEFSRLKAQIASLEKDLIEERVTAEKERTEASSWKAKAEELGRSAGREKTLATGQESGVNVEYLKNVILNFILVGDPEQRQRLVPVVATVLNFSPEEREKAIKSNQSSFSLFGAKTKPMAKAPTPRSQQGFGLGSH